MNQSAITMLQKTIELMTKETCIDLMPEMIPPLLTVNSNKFYLLFFFSFKKKFFLKKTQGVGCEFPQYDGYCQCKCMRTRKNFIMPHSFERYTCM
jgi:hypothetical protein